MGNVCTHSVRGSEGVLRGWRDGRVWGGGRGGIELFVSLFWAPLPLLQMSICSPPSSKCWGCRWPTEESTYQSLPGYLPICLPIYSSAHLMTIHPVHFTILLPLLHLSDNQSINTSICASIQQFIYLSMYLPHHSSICLSCIHPAIHPHSLTRFHQFPAAPSRLHLSCLKLPCGNTTRPNVTFPHRQTKNKRAFQSLDRVRCNHCMRLDTSGKMQSTATCKDN